MARRAWSIDAGEEEQLDHDEAFSRARLAASLGDVEGEASRIVAAGACRAGRGEQLPHVIEQARVGREVRPRRPADRLLVHAHQARDLLHAPRRFGRSSVTTADRSSSSPSSSSSGRAWPRCSATSSTSAWLTRLDFPEPDTPVTVVKTPSGKAASSPCRLLRVTPARRSQPFGRAWRPARRRRVTEQVTPRLRCLDPLEPRGRPAVEDRPTLLTRAGAHVDDPVGVPHHVQVVLDDEQGVARGLQPVERRQERRGVDRMQPGRRLVQHVHDAEQVRAHLRGEPKPLQFTRRQRGRAALERQIAEPEVEEDRETRLDVLGNALSDDHLFRMVAWPSSPDRRRLRGRRDEGSRQACVRGSRDISAMSRPANVTESDSRTKALAVARRAFGAQHVARDPLLHQRAVRVWRTCAARGAAHW